MFFFPFSRFFICIGNGKFPSYFRDVQVLQNISPKKPALSNVADRSLCSKNELVNHLGLLIGTSDGDGSEPWCSLICQPVM